MIPREIYFRVCRRRYYNTVPTISRKTNKREFHPLPGWQFLVLWIFIKIGFLSSVPLVGHRHDNDIPSPSEGRCPARKESRSTSRWNVFRVLVHVRRSKKNMNTLDWQTLSTLVETLLGSTRFSICPRRAWRNLWRREKGLMAVYVLQVGE